MQATYISHYLTDQDVANFARQSFAKDASQYTPEQNASLIKYLARGMSTGDWESEISQVIEGYDDSPAARELAKRMAHRLRNIHTHWVPFGHPQITLRMTAPVPIRVQCFKHKIGFVESEESRRYISHLPDIYVPKFRSKAANVKQGSGDTHPRSSKWMQDYAAHTGRALELYAQMLEDGVCPEQARFVLPQGAEVNWVWTGSLYAYANFYNQRSDSHAQKEVQELARQVDEIIAPLFPISWAALTKGEY